MTRHSYPYPFQPDEEPGIARAWILVLLMLLLLAAVVYFAPRDLTMPVAPAASPLLLSPGVNPELHQVQRYQAISSAQSSAIFEARYPELRLVDRYQSEQAALQEAAFMAQNPELRTFFAYNADDGRLDSAFLAQNPEVGVYRRYLADNR